MIVFVVIYAESRGFRESVGTHQRLDVVKGPGVAIRIDRPVEGGNRLALGRSFDIVAPGKAAIVATDAEFPEHESGFPLEVTDDTGDGLALATHALRAERVEIRSLRDAVIMIFMPGDEIGIRASREIRHRWR